MLNSVLKKRFLATLVDGALVAILFLATYYTLLDVGYKYAKLVAYLNCYTLIIVFPVFVWPGQSIGKRLMKLIVITSPENGLNRKMLFVRELCKGFLFSGITEVAAVLLLMFPLINKKRVAIHDILTGTRVTSLDNKTR